jgi:hypothetical protein
MQILDILGERLFLDYLIVNNFNFTYLNKYIDSNISSYCDISDIDAKKEYIQLLIDNEMNSENPDQNLIDTYNRSINMLNDLKNNLGI